MPLTDNSLVSADPFEESDEIKQRRKELADEGFYDPSQPQQQIVNNSQNKNTIGEAVATGARRSIGSTIGGLALAGAGTILAPETGGLSGLLIPAGLGMAGSMVGGGVQDAVEPLIRGETDEQTEARKQHEAQLQQQHPIATEVGEVAPNILAFRPSGGVVKQAFSGGKQAIQSLGNTALSAAQKGALGNIAVNAGMGAGGSAISSIIHGETPDPEDMAKQALINATLFHEPWLAGTHVFGFHPTANTQFKGSSPVGGINIPYGNTDYTAPIGPTTTLGNQIDATLPQRPSLTGGKASDTFLAKREAQSIADESEQRKVDFMKATLEKQKQDEADTEPTLITGSDLQGSGKPLTQNQLNIIEPSLTGKIADNRLTPTPVEEQPIGLANHMSEVDRGNVENETKPQTEAERIQEQFDNEYQKAGNAKNNAGDEDTVKFITEKLSTMPEGPIKEAFKQSLEDYRANPEDGYTPPDLTPEGLKKSASRSVNGAEPTRQTNTRSSVPKTEPISSDLSHLGNPLPSEPVDRSNFNIPKPIADYLESRGFTVKGGNLKVDPNLQTPSGESAAGKFSKSSRDITLNPETSGSDTAVHEVVHSVINDSASNPSTKPFMDRILTQLRGTVEQHPESSVQRVGEIVNNNIRNGADAPFWKTLISNIKLKLGVGKDIDAINALVEHSQNLAPHSEISHLFNGATARTGGNEYQNYIGDVDHNNVVKAFKNNDKFKQHYEHGLGMSYNRWRYNKDSNSVLWTTKSNPEVRDAVENYLIKRGIYPKNHVELDGGRLFNKDGFIGYSGDEEYQSSNATKEQLQDKVTKSFRDNYAARQMYKDIKVEANPTIDNKNVGGKYSRSEDTVTAQPNNTDLALHEVTHRIFTKNKDDINALIKQWVSETPYNEVSKTLRDMGETLATRHDLYSGHKHNLDLLANAIDERKTGISNMSDKGIRVINNALDEIVAQSASQDFKAEKDINTAVHSITSILGNKFLEHVVFENKQPEYYPKFRNTSQDTIDSLQKQLQEVSSKHISNPTDESRSKLQEVYNKLQLAKRQNQGEYYQLSSPSPEVNNIHLGAPDELAKLDNRSTLQRIGDALNPFNITKSEISKIRDNVPSREGPYIADKFSKVAEDSNLLQGKHRGLIEAIVPLNKGERDLLERTMIQEFRSSKSLRNTLSPKLQSSYDTIRSTLVQMQKDKIASGEMVKDYVRDQTTGKLKEVMRLPKVDPYYFPNISAGHVSEALAHPESELYNKLKADFIEWQQQRFKERGQYSEAVANNMFNDLVESLGQAKGRSSSTRFGANRFAEGIGLPDSWLEPDMLIAMQRYLRRSTNDMAFFNNIENDPVASRILGINKDQLGQRNPLNHADTGEAIKDLSVNKNVQNVINQIQGNTKGSFNPTLEAGLNLAKTMLLGPVSGAAVHIVNVPFTMAKYAAAADMPKIVMDGITRYKEGLQHSYENGFSRKDATLISDLALPTTTAASKLYQLRNIVYKINGRKAIETFGKGLTQSMAEVLLEQNLIRAQRGEKQQVEFFKQLGVTDLNSVKDQIPTLARRIGEYVQGTYDYRTLPNWALNSSIAPIFSLARWHIEQTNHFYNHVIQPAAKGDIQPLLMATLGSALGGYVIEKLKETAYDKKSYIPSLQEMAASSRGVKGNVGNAAYSLLAMTSYAGYAGILTDMARGGLDFLNHNNPQSYNFPGFGVVQDTIHQIEQATQSLVDGKATFQEVWPKLIGNFMLRNFQLARLANTWILEKGGLNQQGKDRADYSAAQRDLGVFNRVEGRNVTGTSGSASDINPYENQKESEFKHTKDISRAAKLLPDIIQHDQQTAKNPADLKQSLTGLRSGMNYNTIPSPARQPQLSAQYLKWIADTQGQQAANLLLQDYLRQQQISKMKASLVPRL